MTLINKVKSCIQYNTKLTALNTTPVHNKKPPLGGFLYNKQSIDYEAGQTYAAPRAVVLAADVPVLSTHQYPDVFNGAEAAQEVAF